MLTVTKQDYISSTFRTIFDGLYEWCGVEEIEGRDDIFVFEILLAGHDVAKFFNRIDTIFPNYIVTVATDNLRDCKSTGKISMEIGIASPR